MNGLVEAHYRFDLGGYARAINTPAEGIQRGKGVLMPIGGWLLEPRGYQRLPVIDIRVRTPPGMAFASGLPKVGDAWRLAGATVRFAGYTALGRFELHELVVPAPGSLRPGQPKKDAVLRLALLEGFAESSRKAIVDWVQRTAEAEANYWHGFTAPEMLVGLVPMPRSGVGFGRTQPGGGVTIMVEVGETMDSRRLFNDWVLVHELVHSGMPFIRGRGTWFMEGSATYVEPIIRARAGWKTEEAVWKEWVTDMPQGVGGLPARPAGGHRAARTTGAARSSCCWPTSRSAARATAPRGWRTASPARCGKGSTARGGSRSTPTPRPATARPARRR